MLYSTSDTITGYEVQKNFGAVEGVSFFSLTGEKGRRTDPADGFSKAWKAACEVLAQNAAAANERANAVVAVKTSLAVVPNFSYLMVAVTGTAVCVKSVEAEKDPAAKDGKAEKDPAAKDGKAEKDPAAKDGRAEKDRNAKDEKAKKSEGDKSREGKKPKGDKNREGKKSWDEKDGRIESRIEKSGDGQDKEKKKKKHKEGKESKVKENKAKEGKEKKTRSKEADGNKAKKHSNKKG